MIDPSHNYPPGMLAGDEDCERLRDEEEDDLFWRWWLHKQQFLYEEAIKANRNNL